MNIQFINQLILLPKSIMQQCKEYAINADVSHYAERDGQFDEIRCRQQQYIGKMAESAVSILHPEFGEPDFTKLDKAEKSWDNDLKGGNTVKACDFSAVPSWVFAVSDTSSPETVIWFCQCDIDSSSVKIDYTAQKGFLKEKNMFQPMKKNYDKKRAVYSYDLKYELKMLGENK